MLRNTITILILSLSLVSLPCSGQSSTWWGEITGFTGGGANDIFRIHELDGAGSVTGKGFWSAGVDVRRLFGKKFSLETGASYSQHYYQTTPAPGLGGEPAEGSLGLVTLPLRARYDFFRWFFGDAGIAISLQPGSSSTIENMSGVGVTLGAGYQYRWANDVFVTLRAFTTQYRLLGFTAGSNPHTIWSGGLTLGVGYRFIHLGRCNCPADNTPLGRFF